MSNQEFDGLWSSMTPQDYMEKRVDDQLNWYSDKSALNKRWHHRLQLTAIIAAALVPVVSLSSSEDFGRFVVAIIGCVAAVAGGVVALYQFRELWMSYRSTAEQLKYEKYLFLTGAVPYTKANSFPLFVAQVEQIIVNENKGWKEISATSYNQKKRILNPTHRMIQGDNR